MIWDTRSRQLCGHFDTSMEYDLGWDIDVLLNVQDEIK